ncbi:MAG: PIN domain-containing protein, partial [Planctomycetota bacterium]|nr:PIN domain-containing protein [Planctomycetota bacterium]
MICFDTSPIIWGVQGKAHPSQEHMVDRTKRYIKYLAENKEQIMIPAPALTEYLMHFEVGEQERQRQIIERNFIVPAFDVRAGVLAAELLGNTELVQKIIASGELDKIKVKTDAQIIATAIVNQADKIISHDPDFAKLVQGR